MRLHISDASKLLDRNFGMWLIPRIKTRLLSSIRKYYLGNWDDYINNSEDIKKLYTKTYRTEEIIIFAANHLKCSGVDGELYIELDNNVYVPGFDRLKLITVAKTINYGTLTVKGCPIFTDCLNYFAENIELFAKMFYSI